jgi:hypothetical protein
MTDAEKLRWLASARAEYIGQPFETVEEYFKLTPTMQSIAREVMTARQLADILEGKNDAYGWLPSWKWENWEEICND